MSELTLTLLRLGLLALLWIFIFSVVGVLRTDIYGTAVSRRSQRKALKAAEKRDRSRSERRAPVTPAGGTPAAGALGVAPAEGSPERTGRGRDEDAANTLVVTEGPLTGPALPLRS